MGTGDTTLCVLTDLRLKYFEAYAIQQRLLLLESFQAITNKGMEMAELRKKGLEGSQLEVLQAGIQRDEIALNLQQSRAELNASLQGLMAIVGEPCLSPQVRLEDPSTENATWNWDEVRCRLISGSPELQVAYHRLAQAQANVQRQHAQPIPNLTLQMAGGVDNGTNSGMMNVQVGLLTHQQQEPRKYPSRSCRSAAGFGRDPTDRGGDRIAACGGGSRLRHGGRGGSQV